MTETYLALAQGALFPAGLHLREEPIPGEPERTSGFYRWVDGRPWHRFWYEPEFTPMEPRE